MPDLRFLIQPHPQQIRFMNSARREQLFGGAKRGGKSVALCQKIIALSLAFPGNRGILIRQNLTDLKDSTLVTFETVCPPGIVARHHLGDRKITFKNGSHFIYRGVGDPDELEKVKGIDIGWLASDEPSEIDEQTYLMLLAQLNWKLTDGTRPPYMSLLACNPEPGWVKRRFIDATHKDREFIPSLAKDNPGLPSGYVQYLLDNFPVEWVEKYVNGSWEISEGMVFKEFDQRTHVVDRLPPMSEMDHYGAIDHATSGVVSLMNMGILPTFDHIVTHEYYERERLLETHAAAMVDRLAFYPANGLRYQYTLIDPSTSARVQRNQELVAIRDLYAEQGVNTIPAWNAIGAGIERIKSLLHVNPAHIHPLTGKLGSPRLFVYRSCTNLIREFQELKRKVDPSGNVSYSGTEHALDPIRYIVNSRPRPPAASAHDESALDSATRAQIRAHRNWSTKWDRDIRIQRDGNPDYFHYLGGNR